MFEMGDSMERFKFDADVQEKIAKRFEQYNNNLSEFATLNTGAVRKKVYGGDASVRGEFGVDIDKILHNVLYNRYVDKTQVLSFYKNDDLTRRALHVQLVARISKIIGFALGLNTDLIEAIALGHDIGHTPFGHKGEAFLNDLYYQHTGRYFNHNVHSVRSLMVMTNSNLTLQTYDGILCHCGEKAFDKYEPGNVKTFDEFEQMYEKCYTEKDYISHLRPSTLEGCVVRISDMIAYLIKDRQDAVKVNLCQTEAFAHVDIGKGNSEVINNIIKNIISNSMGKPYLKMDKAIYEDIIKIKDENTEKIYANNQVNKPYIDLVKPMMEKLYLKLVDDVLNKRYDEPVFQHHLNHSILGNCYRDEARHIIADADIIVTDYIASMTDDYFIDLFQHTFPDDPLCNNIHYISYFDK